MVVQNRCFAALQWDREVRDVCREHGVVYQGFSLLTANQPFLAHPAIHALARKYGTGPAQIVFRFAIDVGMVPLTGTTREDHMRDDLRVDEFELRPDEVGAIETIAG
jgi:diketogulonate reductase-like aldo/keto reductase